MGIIKFEVDIPDFDKELQINITLRKDGEIIETKTQSSLPTPSLSESVKVKEKVVKKSTAKKSASSLIGGGNLMNLDDD
jgi:hypothetical protein